VNVVVSNIKGGVGKTTTAVYLSAAAVARGYDPVVLVDADRQASSAQWLEDRPVEGVTVVEAPSERTMTRALSRNDGLVIVDTPPGDERLLQSAAHRCMARARLRDPARNGRSRKKLAPRKGEAFYRWVAEVHREASKAQRSPAKEIARLTGAPENRAHQWIHRSRELAERYPGKGFLEPSRRSKRKEKPNG
jgi:hypothetical protein